MTRVLVADPDPASRRLATAGLRDGGYDVETAQSHERVVSLLRRRRFVGVVVDPDAIDPNATEHVGVIRDLRRRTELPIIVVSERNDEWDKVEALNAGADDYMTKPFGAEELVARLRAVLRRSIHPDEARPIVTHDFTIYVADRRWIRADGTEAPLSPTEWKLVEVLLRHPGHLVTQADLLRMVWGPEDVDKTAYLRVHMANIRRKVEPNPTRPRYFVTAPGLGLRFVPQPARRAELAV
jgi:two-component system KDP operon response regulator KdpE